MGKSMFQKYIIQFRYRIQLTGRKRVYNTQVASKISPLSLSTWKSLIFQFLRGQYLFYLCRSGSLNQEVKLLELGPIHYANTSHLSSSSALRSIEILFVQDPNC